MKTWWSGDIAPQILNLSTRCRKQLASHTSHYPLGKGLLVYTGQKAAWARDSLNMVAKEKISVTARNQTLVLHSIAVTILTEYNYMYN
jgi:hypothetical protein